MRDKRDTERQREIDREIQRETERKCGIGTNTDRERDRGRETERVWFGLFGFQTSSSTIRLYRGQVPRLTSDNFTYSHTTRLSGETMTSVTLH